MDTMDEEDIDIAAAMGFSSFGGTKKRKHDEANSPKTKAGASGANSTQLGVRTKKVTLDEALGETSVGTSAAVELTTAHGQSMGQKSNRNASLADYLAGAEALPETSANPQSSEDNIVKSEQSATELVSFGGTAITKAELNALRFGVKDENGDTAYFLASFVEDPWEKLEKVRK